MPPFVSELIVTSERHDWLERASIELADHQPTIMPWSYVEREQPGSDGALWLVRGSFKAAHGILSRRCNGWPLVFAVLEDGTSENIAALLDLGAVDCVRSDISMRELKIRVSNLLDRAAGTAPGSASTYVADRQHWVLDERGHYLAAPDGTRLSLSPAEYELVALFIRSANRLLTREHILSALSDETGLGRTVDVWVSRLRSKLEAGHRSGASLIKTERAVGYGMFAQVRRLDEKWLFTAS